MDSLTRSISNLLIEPKYSDLEIRCGGKAFSVHRNIVCAQSDVLQRECDGEFKEARSRVIEHAVYDSRAMDRMLQFMYRGDYVLESVVPLSTQLESITDTSSMSTPETNETAANGEEDAFIAHIYTYAIADYYQVQELKWLALEKFRKEMDSCLNISAEKLLEIASALYEHTSGEARELRKELLTLSYQHQKASVDSEIFMRAIASQQELQQYSADFIGELVERHRVARNADHEVHEDDISSWTAKILAAEEEHKKQKQQLETRLAAESRNSGTLRTRTEIAERQTRQLLWLSKLEKCTSCNAATTFEAVLQLTSYHAKCKSCKKINALRL